MKMKKRVNMAIFKRICDFCGNFYEGRGEKYCSCKCCGETKLGNNHPNWRGGTRRRKGYLYIVLPYHPFRNIKNTYPEHRYIMEWVLDRFLKLSECVHHINGIRNDNDIQNLYLFPSLSDHIKYHNYIRRNDKKLKSLTNYLHGDI